MASKVADLHGLLLIVAKFDDCDYDEDNCQ
jgi:hypothetical protein